MKFERLWRNIFSIYLSLVIVFVVVKPNGMVRRVSAIRDTRMGGDWNYNFIPFRSMTSYLENITEPYAYTNILGNVIPFVPLGFLLPLVYKKIKGFAATMSVCILSILGVESFQFVTMLGFFDIDDILLNTSGCLLGYLVYAGFEKRSGGPR